MPARMFGESVLDDIRRFGYSVTVCWTSTVIRRLMDFEAWKTVTNDKSRRLIR